MSLGNNIRKARNYMKRNGIKSTFYASLERLSQDAKKYEYKDISEAEAKIQREARFNIRTRFSIVVPTYETNEIFAKEMIRSVLNQTYPNFELVISDSSASDKVEKVVRSFDDERITYIRNTENRGIAENTNVGIRVASGQYIGLLDHDDLLTRNALYEMARVIEEGKKDGVKYAFVYSDEDKCDTYASRFYEPHYKPEFNLDLLLSNNYICHFMVMEASLIKKLELRSEFDGAQDHDLVLRAYHQSGNPIGKVNKILYHWRCHEDSTASNPESKRYAYEAGRRAVQDFLKKGNINGLAVPTKHNGFFRVMYGAMEGENGEINTGNGMINVADIFKSRFDIGVVGGPIIKHNKITGGMLDDTRTCPLEGQNINFSGYMHRNALQQDVLAVDIRKMYIRKELLDVVSKVAGKIEYSGMLNRDLSIGKDGIIDVSKHINSFFKDEILIQNLSVEICEACSLEGYRILYDPNLEELL